MRAATAAAIVFAGLASTAIAQSTTLLRLGGLLTVLAYTGHDSGQAEADVVAELLERLPTDEFVVTKVESQPGRTAGPRLFLVKRIACESDGALG